MAIRYDKKLNQEINRVIKNFNQKIARLEKENRELLPSKITKKEIKDEVYNRKELKRKLAELKRFSSRGAEDIITTKTGVRMTNYEYKELKREATRVKKMVSSGIKEMEINKPKVFGKEQARTFAQMGDSDYLGLVGRRKALDKDITKLSKEELERYKKLVRKTGANKQYMDNVFKNNYFKMLASLGYYTFYDSYKLKNLKEKITQLHPNQFLKMFKNEKAIRAILDYYPMVNGTIQNFDPGDIAEDVANLYDSLIDNIDDIMKDYA